MPKFTFNDVEIVGGIDWGDVKNWSAAKEKSPSLNLSKFNNSELFGGHIRKDFILDEEIRYNQRPEQQVIVEVRFYAMIEMAVSYYNAWGNLRGFSPSNYFDFNFVNHRLTDFDNKIIIWMLSVYLGITTDDEQFVWLKNVQFGMSTSEFEEHFKWNVKINHQDWVIFFVESFTKKG